MERKTSRKLVQVALLLISSMLIATASAAVYNLMYMNATVTAEAAKVYFTTVGAEDADEAGTEVGTGGTYVKFTSLSGWPNATRVYEKVVVIINEHTEDVTCTLKVFSVEGVGDLDQLEFIVDTKTLNARTVGNSIDITIDAESSVTVGVRIKWNADANPDTTANVTLELKVPGE